MDISFYNYFLFPFLQMLLLAGIRIKWFRSLFLYSWFMLYFHDLFYLECLTGRETAEPEIM